jgi:enoyl-CoA hydratase/carnithine racemase
MLDERRYGVNWLTFDRPDRLNAFTATDYEQLHAAILASG